MKRIALKFLDAKDTDDAERAILPALVFTYRKLEPDFCGAMLSIGWWRWGIGLAVFWKARLDEDARNRDGGGDASV